jgi:uncharacterized protein (TIGR02453 family)
MKDESGFRGFPRECVQFYEKLAKNNSKAWFDAHKGDFEAHVMVPARSFVYAMGERLSQITPGVIADPRVNKSIFRPYRDTRFSNDKRPYKTHLGIFFWVGPLAKMDCPGYYFHLEPPVVMLGVGNHCFSKEILDLYREAVVDPDQGPALVKALQAIRKKGDYEIGIRHYKKVPRGYDKDHPNADLLLFNGLTAAYQTSLPRELYSGDFVEYAFARFSEMQPIVDWLLHMISKPKS